MLIKKGATGEDVKVIQKALGILADGIFGPGTEAKVKYFQKTNGLTADGIVGRLTYYMIGISPSGVAKDLPESIIVSFPKDQYKHVETNKKQIYVHHTVSGGNAIGDINWWKSNDADIATTVVIDRNGGIYQVFPAKYWAHHLGIKSSIFKGFKIPSINTKLNRESIGIEIDSWGGLTKNDKGEWLTYTKKVISNDKVIEYPEGFRGYYAFEKYTDSQIAATKKLINKYCSDYDITSEYKGEEMWDMSIKALKGEPGIWAHVSVRPDKSDCHPQIELINMLKNLD